MKVAEKFVSINGEGMKAGEPAVFIRFQGCNLNCGYCDTKWANEADCPYEEMSPAEIFRYVRDTGITDVTLTGGEPLLQKDMNRLLALLLADPELYVEIETNGSVDLAPFCKEPRPCFTMDYKLPSSGCERAMREENFALLGKADVVKFVAGNEADLKRAKELIGRYDLTGRTQVYFSPVFGEMEPVRLVEFLLKNRMNHARVQIQMHKVIWDPDKRGV